MIESFLEKVKGGYNLNRWRSSLSPDMTEEKVEGRRKAWCVFGEEQGVLGCIASWEILRDKIKKVEARMWGTLNARLRCLDLKYQGFCTKIWLELCFKITSQMEEYGESGRAVRETEVREWDRKPLGWHRWGAEALSNRLTAEMERMDCNQERDLGTMGPCKWLILRNAWAGEPKIMSSCQFCD